MKTKILFLSIVLFNLGCSHQKIDNANRKPKQNGSAAVVIRPDSLKLATRTVFNDSDSPEYPDWADTIIVTQKLTTEARDIIDQSVLKVIDVSSSDYREVAHTNIQSPLVSEAEQPMLGDAV